MKKNKISIIGVGYVGLPLALKLQGKNYVVGFDTNKQIIKELNDGFDIFNDQKKKK